MNHVNMSASDILARMKEGAKLHRGFADQIELRLTDDDGENYQGIAELKRVAPVLGPDEDLVHTIVEPEVKGLPGHILALRGAGFFHEPRTPSEAHAKLLETYHCLLNRVQMGLLRLHRRRELRKTTKKIGDQEHVAYVW